jgi:hypothetical protein
MKRNRAIITACAEKLTFAFQTPRHAGDPLRARRLKSGVSNNRERPRFDRACASCEFSGGRHELISIASSIARFHTRKKTSTNRRRPMIYEFKTYQAHDGKIDQLIARFKEKTMPVFARLGIEVVNCWTSDAEPGAFSYLVRFDSDAARQSAWAAFAADSEWKAAKGASETAGALLRSQSVLLLKPTDFSPIR